MTAIAAQARLTELRAMGVCMLDAHDIIIIEALAAR